MSTEHRVDVRWAWLASLALLVGCGGVTEGRDLYGGDRQSRVELEGAGGSAATGSGSGAKDAGDEPPVSGAPVACPSDIVVGQNGWRFEVACPTSVAHFCAQSASGAAPCILDWSDASRKEAWCSKPGVTAFVYIPACKGFNAVSVFGDTPVGSEHQLFNTYYYDLQSGDLVHVDSNAIPSFSQCVAGECGSVYDIFFCESEFAECGN